MAACQAREPRYTLRGAKTRDHPKSTADSEVPGLFECVQAGRDGRRREEAQDGEAAHSNPVARLWAMRALGKLMEGMLRELSLQLCRETRDSSKQNLKKPTEQKGGIAISDLVGSSRGGACSKGNCEHQKRKA